MKVQYHTYASPEATAAALASFFRVWASDKTHFTVALSGGNTPKILYRHLAQHYGKSLDWEHIHFFWGDERCVPPDHSDSNFKMANEALLQHISIPAENVHRIRGEAPPAEAAQLYADEIQRFVKQKNGVPAFDLVLLGIGNDGHTASIFPNNMELLKADGICAVATHPESGQQRISLCGPVINNARKVAFMATGGDKWKVVQAIRQKSEQWESYPAAHIQATEELHWFLDEAAA